MNRKNLTLESIRQKRKQMENQKKYNFEIVRMELKENEFGKNDIVIRQVKVLDEDGNYVKFAKLNDALIDALKEQGTIKIKQ